MEWLNTIIQGLLLGGLYAMFAIGLSLMFGIMRLVNIAHGDFIVLGSYLSLVVISTLGLSVLWGFVLVVPLMFFIGYFLQKYLLNRTLGNDILPPLLVTFGLSIILQNLLMEIFTSNSQKVNVGEIEVLSIHIMEGLNIGVLPLIVFVCAIAIVLALQYIFYRTELGRVFRATSDDQNIVQLMGVKNSHVFSLAMGIAMAVVAIAGIFLAMRTNFDPSIGPARLLYGFEAVIIGGLGSIWGTLIGGIILGISQSIGAKIDPGFQILAGHIVFLVILIFKPRGLFPRSID